MEQKFFWDVIRLQNNARRNKAWATNVKHAELSSLPILIKKKSTLRYTQEEAQMLPVEKAPEELL